LLLASHFQAGDFFMRRYSSIAGSAVTMTYARCIPRRTNAQQPSQRVQVGILECAAVQASARRRFGDQPRLRAARRGMPEDRYVATIRKVGPISASPRNRRSLGAVYGRSRGSAGRSSGIMPARRAARRSASASGEVLVGGSGKFDRTAAVSLQARLALRRGRLEAWNFGREGEASPPSHNPRLRCGGRGCFRERRSAANSVLAFQP